MITYQSQTFRLSDQPHALTGTTGTGPGAGTGAGASTGTGPGTGAPLVLYRTCVIVLYTGSSIASRDGITDA